MTGIPLSKNTCLKTIVMSKMQTAYGMQPKVLLRHTSFAPDQKVKIAFTKFKFYKRSKVLLGFCKLWHFKMTGRPCTDEVRVTLCSVK